MSKAQGKSAEKAAPERRPAAKSDGGGAEALGGNLDQVREILFGAQSRSVEKRIARIEEELPKRAAELREELKRGLATLEAYARREIDSLNERLRAESAERGKADDQLGAKAEDTAKALRREIAGLDERSTAAQRDLRQHLLDQTKRLDEEIQRRSDDLAAAIARAVEELRFEKADRKAVAGILHEVAMRLTDELSLPLEAEPES
jgi:DNA repair exonuclease SbcCD ATPase subunit